MIQTRRRESVTLFLVKFYSIITPTIVQPDAIFNKICSAAVPQLRMILNKQLYRPDHLRRQLDGSVLLGQFLKPNSDQFLSIYSWGKTYLTFEDKILSIILHDSDSDFPWEICFTLTILPEEKKRNHRLPRFDTWVACCCASDFN